MKINSFNTTNVIKTYAAQNKKEKVDSETNINGTTSDRVELSAKAKELFELKKKAVEIPELRANKVEELKAQIEKGEYQIKSQEIAKKLLGETFK